MFTGLTGLFSNGGVHSPSKDKRNLCALVSKELWPFRGECKLANFSLNLQYKCWIYKAEFRVDLLSEATEYDLKVATVRGVKAFYKAFQSWHKTKELYYKPSDLYLYYAFVKKENYEGMIFLSQGNVRYLKEQRYLTEEEKILYKDQLTKFPNENILIWKKPFEEVAREVGIDCSEIIRDPEDVLNFSENDDVRKAILTVRQRVFDSFSEEGYSDYISVSYDKMALRNKHGPYEWMFFLERSIPHLKSKREKPIPYDPKVYQKEYERLLPLIVNIINEAPELKPYLKRPVTRQDVELNFKWRQNIGSFEERLGSYNHLVYRTHSSWITEWIYYIGGCRERGYKINSIPIEEFDASVERNILNAESQSLNKTESEGL